MPRSETMAWSTRYSPRRWPDRADSSSALVNWSWVSRPASIRTSPSLRRRFGALDSLAFGLSFTSPMPAPEIGECRIYGRAYYSSNRRGIHRRHDGRRHIGREAIESVQDGLDYHGSLEQRKVMAVSMVRRGWLLLSPFLIMGFLILIECLYLLIMRHPRLR